MDGSAMLFLPPYDSRLFCWVRTDCLLGGLSSVELPPLLLPRTSSRIPFSSTDDDFDDDSDEDIVIVSIKAVGG